MPNVIEILIRVNGEIIDRATFPDMELAAKALHLLHRANVNRRYEFELRAR
jgi:hypothetical protein